MFITTRGIKLVLGILVLCLLLLEEQNILLLLEEQYIKTNSLL